MNNRAPWLYQLREGLRKADIGISISTVQHLVAIAESALILSNQLHIGEPPNTGPPQMSYGPDAADQARRLEDLLRRGPPHP